MPGKNMRDAFINFLKHQCRKNLNEAPKIFFSYIYTVVLLPVFMCLVMFFSVLPGRKFINFQDGAVQVELSFSALFSNVLVVFGTVRNTNALAQECTLLLDSEPVSQDFSCLP